MNEINRFVKKCAGFTIFFQSIDERHALIKSKTIRGNNNAFINKELTKAIQKKSRIRFNNWISRENNLEYQDIKKKCKFVAFKAEKEHFGKFLSKGIITNKEFWKKIALYLSRKDIKHTNNIVLEESNELITDDTKISEILNDQYINIVEKYR